MVVRETAMIDAAEVQQRLAHFPARCRAAGLKVTQQRLAVYGMLAATDTHPTPEEVFEAIRADLPLLSLATVYKILEQFHRAGFVRKVSTEGQAARYDVKMEPHHHLVCTDCGAIHDIHLDTVPDLMSGIPANANFEVARYDVIFHGLCGACRAKRSPSNARSA